MFTTLQQREFNKIQQTVNIKTKNKYAKLETANCAAEGNHICSKTLNKLFFKSFTVRQKSYKSVCSVHNKLCKVVRQNDYHNLQRKQDVNKIKCKSTKTARIVITNV